MSETYYKGVKPDGTDFYSGTVQWAPEKTKARKGRIVRHPSSTEAVVGDFTTFLSVSTDPTNLPGTRWPLRLLEVEPVTAVHRVDALKRGGTSFRVVREVDPSIRFGHMGAHVAALIDRASRLTAGEAHALRAAWGAAWGAVARDLIGRGRLTQEHYDLLTGPWRKAIGPIHPDDKDMR